MKKVLYTTFALAVLGFSACSKSETKTETTEHTETSTATEETEEASEIKEIGTTTDGGKIYGSEITAEGAIPVSDLKTKMGDKENLDVKIKGEIVEVCQNKGCWVTVKLPSGEDMRVKFGEDAFFVPKDASGKTAVMEGKAMKEIVSVDEQRHYLEDAGKPKAEIEAITKPDTTLTFDAKGIIVYN